MAISSYAIKGDRDRLGRLPAKLSSTARLSTPRCWSPRTVSRAAGGSGAGVVGRLEIRSEWALVDYRIGQVAVSQPDTRPHRTPFAIAQLLWRDEVYAELQDRGLVGGLS